MRRVHLLPPTPTISYRDVDLFQHSLPYSTQAELRAVKTLFTISLEQLGTISYRLAQFGALFRSQAGLERCHGSTSVKNLWHLL